MTQELVPVQCELGRRAATHFVLQHVHGIKGVALPDTALFDDEGVLVEWLVPSQSNQVLRKKKIQNTNLLLFELRLQELAEARGSTNVAVLWDDTVVLYDESRFDVLVRMLCAREAEMLAPVPHLSGPRKFGNGRFCLQAFVDPSDDLRYVTELDAAGKTRLSKIASGVKVYATPYGPSLETGHLATKCVPREIESVLQQAVMSVFSHLQKHMQVEEMVLEWVLSASAAKKQVQVPVLIGAQSIRYARRHDDSAYGPAASTATKESSSSDAPVEGVRRAASVGQLPQWSEEALLSMPIVQHIEDKVCRFCRRPRELELSRELAKTQSVFRHTIGKLQTREREFDQSREEAKALQQKIHDLDVTVNELHNQLKREGAQAKFVAQQLQQRCDEIERQREKTQASLELEEATRAAVEETVQELEAKLAQLNQTHDMSQKLAQLDLKRAHNETDNHLRNVHSLKAALAKMTAERDDCLAFRAYLFRRLADTTQPGVDPPKRCAGGFWSYPSPSPENVAEVVRVLVDSQRNVKAKSSASLL
ncbi:hypothetical protein ACHHYP_05370 [Achlya hypogyna]|uniref:Uncharacterized protein n=1 Tax=Achlya hypogyna TaxID=1202772 RepID=A0A1V9YY84_ACHHY|nr:hypothetical protein ACHHYP_05370 [Achlya hypogyna]